MTDRELFDIALGMPEGTIRGQFLDAACPGNPEQSRRVQELLASHQAAGSFLEAPNGQETASVSENVPASTADYPGKDEVIGATIAGKYKLLEVIGEGGMGSVYMAQQTAPVKRFVAVKVIKAGMDSKSVLARFDAERQALAVMDHPNIAKVLDAGVTDQQRPFFVMELVKGLPITEYCDLRKLTPRQRLELFVPVCQAIQHAHQKGIIHRDIKPSNVIVALYDDRPVPKVIDFGVAKATGAMLTEQTLATGFGGIVGTPQYMSPEQATFNNLDIDTRSDVYSLGVLLYELLAGSPPFSRKDLEKAGFLEILRVVREEEPPRPSAKLSTAAAVASLCANRGMEPRKLAGLLRNELDWIAMKALEKDRTRRYETANGLAADIQRYIAGEQVLAHPPSAGYRLRKFLQKNRGPAIAASLLFAALTAGIFGTTYSYLQARTAEADALTAKKETEEQYKIADFHRRGAETERDFAKEQQKKATAESARANEWSKFSGQIIDALTRHRDPATGDLAIAKALDEVANALGRQGLDPAVERQARLQLGLAYAAGRDPRSALVHYNRAQELGEKLGRGRDEWLTISLSTAHFDLGEFAKAEHYLELLTHPAFNPPKKPEDPMEYMAGIAHRYVRLAEIKLGLGKFDEAVKLLAEVEGMQAKKQEIERLEEEIARAKDVKGKPVARKVRHSDPKELPVLRLMLGEALTGAGRGEEARKILEAAVAEFRTSKNQHGPWRDAYRASLAVLIKIDADRPDDLAKWSKELESLGDPAVKGVQGFSVSDWVPPGTNSFTQSGFNNRNSSWFVSSLSYDRTRQFYARRVSFAIDDIFSGTDVNLLTGIRSGSQFEILDEPDAAGRKASSTFIKIEDKRYTVIRVYVSRLPNEKAESVKVQIYFLPRP